MSTYPESFDSDTNLYLVHDYLRVKLAEDYNPGDTSITVDGDTSNFPPSGIITLTEQCSEMSDRAISLSYSSRTDTTFDGLELLANFPEVAKSKRITNVTLNVFAGHHNALKDAIIAVENFVGIKGEVSATPLEGTVEARVNFLRRLVLKPRAWFSATRTVGIKPLCLEFKDFSSRQPDVWTWDFGDGTISVISRSNLISTGTVSKCYFTPGIFDVSLTVENDFGSNIITIPEYVTVRVDAPDPATIEFIALSSQILDDGVLRTRTNRTITVNVDDNGEQPDDPIESYIWEFGDDLTHDEISSTTASYSVGGIYDIKLRTETELGAYRVTVFEDVIDVVERFNLWHIIFSNDTSISTTKNAYVYEFGLISETYKAAPTSTQLSVTRNAGFLSGKDEYDRQFAEFRRNNGSNPRTTVSSGDGGDLLVYWAEGASLDTDSQDIEFRQLNGFESTWTSPMSSLTRYWNWVALNSETEVHFILGVDGPYPLQTDSPTNQVFQSVSMNNLSVNTQTFTSANYENGADELMYNVEGGQFSVYRSAWRDDGYFIRNDGTGDFFRLKSFYGTEGIVGNPINLIRKLSDLVGATKFEGQLVNLANGLYFFNNSGEFLIYNTNSNVWQVGGVSSSSTSFSALQDKTVDDYNSLENRLIAVSDGDRKAYLFFDYSTRANIKFNEADFTFSTLTVRPSGEQFLASIY